jgi:hypothetical protein
MFLLRLHLVGVVSSRRQLGAIATLSQELPV